MRLEEFEFCIWILAFELARTELVGYAAGDRITSSITNPKDLPIDQEVSFNVQMKILCL